jgi:hypothetical protein
MQSAQKRSPHRPPLSDGSSAAKLEKARACHRAAPFGTDHEDDAPHLGPQREALRVERHAEEVLDLLHRGLMPPPAREIRGARHARESDDAAIVSADAGLCAVA